MTREEARERVLASRRAQGLPDALPPETLAHVARIIAARPTQPTQEHAA